MMNPPGGAEQAPPFAMQDQAQRPPQAPQQQIPKSNSYALSIQEPEDQQKAIVSACVSFKKSAVRHSQKKKETMMRCYAYSKNKLMTDDLLPLPSTSGSDNDAKSNRPQVFLPITRQNLKSINSQLKMTIFPNDEDYFRIRAKKQDGVILEDPLTEGFKYLMKQCSISEKLGGCLWDTTWSGMFIAYPTIRQKKVTQWEIQPTTNEDGSPGMEYIPSEIDMPAMPDVECWNALNFYVDPNETDPEESKWVYISRIKKREISESSIYINKDQLDSYASKTIANTKDQDFKRIDDLNDMAGTFDDAEDSLDYAEYYFPYLKVGNKEYKNFIVGIVSDTVLVRFHPNLFPRGLNPVVFTGWMYEPRNPYPQGPAEDMMGLQRLCNLLENFKIEDMARGSNKYVASPSANFENMHGVVGGIIVTENPGQDVIQLPYNPAMAEHITNEVGVWKAEAQTVAGSQNPFQGSANIDTKKTATEMQLLESQFQSIIREVTDHLANMGVQRVFERIMYLVGHAYSAPIDVPVDSPQGGQQYIQVDFSPLATGDFTIELVGINPSQSKQAQVSSIMQIISMIQEPEQLIILEPVLRRIGQLQGIKDIDILIQEVKERMGMVDAQQQQQAAMQAGMGASGQPPMAGANPAQASAA